MNCDLGDGMKSATSSEIRYMCIKFSLIELSWSMYSAGLFVMQIRRTPSGTWDWQLQTTTKMATMY